MSASTGLPTASMRRGGAVGAAPGGGVAISPDPSWLMSAPETNARSPEPRTMTTRTSGSSAKARATRPSAASMSPVMALCFSGLSNTIVPMPSATVARSCSHPVSITRDRSKQSREADVADAAPSAGPLAGIRLVDLTRARAGPTCVRQLADLGADVVQVVDPAQGDIGGSDSANLQRNKRSIALDLKSRAGVDAFLALI